MKLQMNALMGNWGPGDYLKFAKQALVILQQCWEAGRLTDVNTKRECLNIIGQYIQVLNTTNQEFAQTNKTPRRSAIMMHSFFLSDLYLYDPNWVQSKMECYPYAFMHVGEEWCAWTTILR